MNYPRDFGAHFQDITPKQLNGRLKDIDSEIALAMSNIRRAQGMTFKTLEARFSGIKGNTLKRYMQQSYPSIRPLHVLAAYSWVMMVPMSFLYHRILFSDVDKDIIEICQRIGHLPIKQFQMAIMIFEDLLPPEKKERFESIKMEKSKLFESTDERSLRPPETIDLQSFAIDYYRSIALKISDIRQRKGISITELAAWTGLSDERQIAFESPNKITPFSTSTGLKVIVGLSEFDYAIFSSEMKVFPAFHQFRTYHEARVELMIFILKSMTVKQRIHAAQVLGQLSTLFSKTVM